jgi:hypothetical protein
MDQVALFSFDGQVHPILTFEQWNAASMGERVALATRQLADISPGWSATRTDAALIQAAESVADNGGKPSNARGEIILLSDLEDGSHMEQLQGYEWPGNIQVTIEPLKPKRIGNASIQLITESEGSSAVIDGIRVRVNNTADSKREQFKIGWANADGRSFAGPAVEVYVPPGQSRIVIVPMPGTAAKPNRIILQGDEAEFDNVAFTVQIEKSRMSVLYFGREGPTESKQPLYFLQRAFQETQHQSVDLRVLAPGSPVSLPELERASLIVLKDPVSAEMAVALHAEAVAGKTIFCVVKDESMARTLGEVVGMGQVQIEEARPSNYVMLSDIDFRDPLFAPFADPKFSDFTKIHFWKYRRVDPAGFPNSRVLAKFDNGDPALIDIPVRKGRILLLTSGWHPDDSQLALSTKFVPLIYSILETSGAVVAGPALYRVGDRVPVPLASGAKVIKPDGNESALGPGQTNFSETLTPGVYTVISGPATNHFCVNLDSTESRTTPISPEEFERLGVPVSHKALPLASTANGLSRLQNTELENRQKLWRWLLMAALSVLLLETWLAGRAARRSNVPVMASAETDGKEALEEAYR